MDGGLTRRRWPTRDEIESAIVAGTGLAPLPPVPVFELERGSRYRAAYGSGANGVIYRIRGRDGHYALKVFTCGQPDRDQRLQLIDQELSAGRPPSLLGMWHRPEALAIGPVRYPVVVMEWASGTKLDLYLEARHERGEDSGTANLCRAWVDCITSLQDAGIAHGDLQHGNIVVAGPDKILLIDYDGMFVPGMANSSLAGIESGLPEYQHPERERLRDAFFGARLDDFSALLILLNLTAADRNRWGRYHEPGAERLLVTVDDLYEPESSALLTELRGAEPPLPFLTEAVLAGLAGPVTQVIPFTDLTASPELAGLLGRRRVAASSPRLPPGLLPRRPGDTVAGVRGVHPAAPQHPPVRAQPVDRLAESTPAEVPVDVMPPPELIQLVVTELSARQVRALRLLADGWTTSAIARQLGVSDTTVRRDLRDVRLRLGGIAQGVLQEVCRTPEVAAVLARPVELSSPIERRESARDLAPRRSFEPPRPQVTNRPAGSGSPSAGALVGGVMLGLILLVIFFILFN